MLSSFSSQPMSDKATALVSLLLESLLAVLMAG
jgi:hypothetical protein